MPQSIRRTQRAWLALACTVCLALALLAFCAAGARQKALAQAPGGDSTPTEQPTQQPPAASPQPDHPDPLPAASPVPPEPGTLPVKEVEVQAGPDLHLMVNQSHDWVGGEAAPDATVLITVTDGTGALKGTGSATAGGDGFFLCDKFESGGTLKTIDIDVGDTIEATSSDSASASATVLAMSGIVNGDTDSIHGHIEGGTHPANIRAEVWGLPEGVDTPQAEGQTDENGNYALQFSDYDLHNDEDVALWYFEPDDEGGDGICIVSRGFTIRVNYAHEWVESNCAPDQTFWITVTNSSGAIKATSHGTTGPVPDMEGRVGFSTNTSGWSPSWPDIAPGDQVRAALSNGQTADIVLGTIAIDPDYDANTVSGTVTVPGVSGRLQGRVEVWVQDGPPGIDFEVDADGGSYLCDLDSVGWDLKRSDDVAVSYLDADHNQVYNVFRSPLPDLHVEMWPEGGAAAAGGSAVWGIRYWNMGTAAAEAVLTDTLPAGTTYISDTSGIPATIGAGTVTWNLGTVAPGEAPVQFYIVLRNTAGDGDTLTNIVRIYAPEDGNWDDNEAQSDLPVASGAPNVNISIDARPGDPAPGQRFDYHLFFGNGGPVASGPVLLTDTLPAGATLVGWRAGDSGSDLWSQVSATGGKLVLCAPALPARWGGRLIVTLQLDPGVAYDTQLINTVEIATADDSDLDDNRAVHEWAFVSPPRYDAGIDTQWGYGTLYPGGKLTYWLELGNQGNSLLHDVVVTDTLPAGTTLSEATIDLGNGFEAPFPADHVDGNRLIWELGDLAVSSSQSIILYLQIDPQVAPGTVLTNSAAISAAEADSDERNNMGVAAVTVQPSGTNLRVENRFNWEGSNRIHYWAQISNIGTQTVDDVVVTDTFPVEMILENWNLGFWEEWQGQVDGNKLSLTLNRLEPGWVVPLEMWLDVPAGGGAWHNNIIEVTTPPDDVNPSDNRSVVAVGTLPDVSVEKRLIGGVAKPGELLTYTLTVRNNAATPPTDADVWLEDTLPDGLEFVEARQRYCGATEFCERPPDYTGMSFISWNLSHFNSGDSNTIIVTVRVSDDVEDGQVLTNTAKAGRQDKVDLDPANNTSTCPVKVTIRKELFLPLVIRS